MGLPPNFDLSALGNDPLLSGFRIFETLEPIASGCGGAGLAGLMSRPGSPATGRACLAIGSGEDGFTEGGLAVNPLLLVNFNSVMLPLRSLFTDLRLHISDLGDEAFAEEAVLDVEFEWRWAGSCGMSGNECFPLSFGGGGGVLPDSIFSIDSSFFTKA